MVLRRAGQLGAGPWPALVFSSTKVGETACPGPDALWFIISERKASVCSSDAGRVFSASVPVFSPPWSVTFGGLLLECRQPPDFLSPPVQCFPTCAAGRYLTSGSPTLPTPLSCVYASKGTFLFRGTGEGLEG